MILFLLGCMATIRASATPDTATLYLTNDRPSENSPPTTYVAKGKGELNVQVQYYTWQEWYLWGGAPGYQSEVVSIPTEPKIGPIIGTLFLWFPVVWAIGPAENTTIDVTLER